MRTLWDPANPSFESPQQRGRRHWRSVSPNDTAEDGKCLAKKLMSLKMWPTENKPWAQSIKDTSGEILCVSQFTLFANINKGSKPDFHGSASPDTARPLYNQFVETMKQTYVSDRVKDGVFGAMMQVGLVNDGPVTFDFDTAKSGNLSSQKEKEDKKKKWEEKKAAGKKAQGNGKGSSEAPASTDAVETKLDGNPSLEDAAGCLKFDDRT